MNNLQSHSQTLLIFLFSCILKYNEHTTRINAKYQQRQFSPGFKSLSVSQQSQISEGGSRPAANRAFKDESRLPAYDH